jgi:pullulanase
MSNASYCGNDFATERYMCYRFIRDVLNYYAKVFGISGFRFDLMGLIDTDTLNKAYDSLKQIDESIMVYGEGWNMGSPLPNEKRSHMYNYQKIPNYAFFNDRFRDFVRGNQFDKVPGYCFGNYSEEYFDLYHLVLGSCYDYYKFSNPCQSINYIECHDNYTLYDFAKIYLGGDLYEVEDGARLGISLVLISLGIPFIHAGQEFLRTKQGVENSYNTKDAINRIDYERRDKYISNVNTVRDLISIRKEYSTFRLSKLEDIKKKIVPLSGLTNIGLAGCLLKDEKGELVVIVKNDREVRKVELDSFTMIFDGYRKCNRSEIAYFIKEPGVYIFKGENGKWN